MQENIWKDCGSNNNSNSKQNNEEKVAEVIWKDCGSCKEVANIII